MASAAKVEKGHQLYRDGKYKEALLFYTEALTAAKAKPQKIALHSNRAACYLKLHDFKQAAEECTWVLELDQKHSGALMLRAQTLVTLKEYHSALFDVSRLLELNPDSEVYQNLEARLRTQLSLAPIPESEAELEEEDEDEASEERDEKEEEKEEVEESNEEEGEQEVRNLRKRKRKKPVKSGEKPKRKGGGGFTKVCSLSPELQAFTGVTELARTEVVKMLWSYIKENNLQDPNDKRTIIFDASLRSLFSLDSINMFQMSKHLTKHIWPLEDNAGESVSSNSPKNGKQKMKSNEESDEAEEKDKKQKKEGCVLLSPFPLSDALVKFLDNEERSLSRADVVKRLWEYIKQNDLQDPSDKRKIICDEKLKELFEVDSFQDTSVSKLLTNHFIKTEQ